MRKLLESAWKSFTEVMFIAWLLLIFMAITAWAVGVLQR